KSKGNPNNVKCTCIALVFLCTCVVPKCTSAVDDILRKGTELFSLIRRYGGLIVSELPVGIQLKEDTFLLNCHEPRSGLVSQIADEPDTLYFHLESALSKALEESDKLFMSIGNSTASTIGIKRESNGSFVVMDSHSRDDKCMCSQNGKAVVLQFRTLAALVQYARDLAKSLSANKNMQYEVTALSISKSSASLETITLDGNDEENDRESLAECFKLNAPDTDVQHMQPDAVDQHVQPDTVVQHVQPDAEEQHMQPDTGEQHMQPDAGEQHVQPDAGEQHVQPDTDVQHVQPNAGEQHVQPDADVQHVQPDASEQHIQPDMDVQHVQPDAGEQHVQPDTDVQHVQPDAGEQQKQPDTDVQHVQPVTDVQHKTQTENPVQVQLMDIGNYN
ncbi:FA5-like protein, partial [Mya arenaria]